MKNIIKIVSFIMVSMIISYNMYLVFVPDSVLKSSYYDNRMMILNFKLAEIVFFINYLVWYNDNQKLFSSWTLILILIIILYVGSIVYMNNNHLIMVILHCATFIFLVVAQKIYKN